MNSGRVKVWFGLTLGVLLATFASSASAQVVPPPRAYADLNVTEAPHGAPAELIPPPRSRGVLGFGSGLRRVQATAADMGSPSTPGASLPAETSGAAAAADNPVTGNQETSEQAAAEAAGEEEAEPTLLMKFLGMEDSPVKIYGWIQNSYTANANGTGNGINFGVTPNYKANSWMGNQYYTIIEKPIEQNDEINFGFRFDSLFGHDWQFNKMYGLFDNAFTANTFRGWDPAQFYLEAHLPVLTEKGLDIKFGRWYTLAGYEVVPAIGRPLLSVPYMFTFGQPFTHFGALTTLNVSDNFKLFNGAINGWDRWQNQNFKWGYIGGFNWTFNDSKTNLAFTAVWGPNQFPFFIPHGTQAIPTGQVYIQSLQGQRNPGYGANDRVLFTTVLSHKWTDKLTQVMETDQAHEQSLPGLADGGQSGAAQSAEWYSFGNWFLYNFTDKLTGVWRSEVFRDDDGARTGFADNFYEITLGMVYKPTDYLWIRPEARYDWAQFKTPFDGGTKGSQFTYGLDVIFLY